MARISKILSPNDTGQTGGHQSGILVPKDESILPFFPHLSKEDVNPRCSISFLDEDGVSWTFNFIYYNNKFRGGTRNEYRLTGMTKYFREKGLVPGDELTLSRNEHYEYFIQHIKNHAGESEAPCIEEIGGHKKLKVSTTWVCISI